MADIYIEYLPSIGNPHFDMAARRIVDLLRTYITEHDTSLSTIETDGYVNLTDSGDLSAFSKTKADLTTDNTWRDLDLSAIVPAGAVAVLLEVTVNDDAAGNSIQFRKNGNSNAYNVAIVLAPVADVDQYQQVIVFCDTSRVIEYKATNTTFTTINIIVSGWFI